MPSLTETAYYTRRTINWLIFSVILYVILRIFWSVVVGVWMLVFPPKAPPPNHAFNVLPKLVFPSPPPKPEGALVYRLETIQGAVPPSSPSATVYFMPKTPANLLGFTRTQRFAEELDLDPNAFQETKNIYRFGDPELPLRKLRYDIVSNNFVLRYNFELDLGLFHERQVPLPEQAINEAETLMQGNRLLLPDIDKGEKRIAFLKLTDDKLLPTTSHSQADAVRVDFFRRPIGGLKVFTPVPDEGQVSFIFSGSTNQKKRIIQFAYNLWSVDESTKATYALKPGSQAWDELQEGKGFIARYPRDSTTAVVRNMYIAYVDMFEPQNYLQPVFVFEGDHGFLAFVPAVAPPWTE